MYARPSVAIGRYVAATRGARGETWTDRVRSKLLRVRDEGRWEGGCLESMAGLWRMFPIGRATAAWWAWKNRRELGRWAGFVWRAVPPSTAGRGDVLAEARLRAALAKDPRTRGVRSLAVRVTNGTALLEGYLPPELHDLVASIARKTKGAHRVECRIRDKGARRTPMSHAHTIPVAAIPPRPT